MISPIRKNRALAWNAKKFFACNRKTKSAKAEIVMKTHLISLRLVLPAGIALIVVVCAIAQTRAPRMSIRETSIQIHPGTKISSDGQKELDAVLKQYNKLLYQIRTYDRGRLVQTQTRGSLPSARIDRKLIAEVDQAAARGVSFIALQIGHEGVGPEPSPTMTPWDNSGVKLLPSPTPPPTNNVTRPTAVRDLVSRVTPILRKYSQ